MVHILLPHQEMVSFVVKAPLADDQVGTRILDHFDHIGELVLLVLPEFLILINASNVQVVLCFRARGFEGTCQDREFRVSHAGGHAGMGKVLVDQDTFDEGSIGKGSTSFAFYFDEVEGNVFSGQVRHLHDCIYSNLGKLLVLLRNTGELSVILPEMKLK